MAFEWLLFGLLLVTAFGLTGVSHGRFRTWLVPAITSAVALSIGIFWSFNGRNRVASDMSLRQSIPTEGRPGGYVSSDRCQACHPDAYDSWHGSYHRTMTQVAAPDTVLGNFNNVSLELNGETFQLNQADGEYWVEMNEPKRRPPGPGQQSSEKPPRVRRRIGLLTGSHHMQVYWIPPTNGNLQQVFSFAWLKEAQRWVPFHNTFLRDPSIGPTKQSWNGNCISCHATGGQPRPNYQTGTLNTRVGELGIACESCHGPAERHVAVNQDPIRRNLNWHGDKPDPTIVNPETLPSKRSAEVCGQCHSIKWIPNQRNWHQFGFGYRPGQVLDSDAPVVRPTRLQEQTWLHEPLKGNQTFLQDRFWSDGMVRVAGREFNGLVESPCFQRGELSCLSCHSMHQSNPDDQLAVNMESNEACLQCHEDFRSSIEQHTHHKASSSGSLCYNCHMPHTTYGLLKAIRSHQIDSPSAQSYQATGRPTACNLCHLEKTLGWTAKHLTEWHGQPPVNLTEEDGSIAAAVQMALRGDAGQRALYAWHMGWEPAQQTSGSEWMAPYLAELLNDPYAVVRYIAGRSLRRLEGFENLDFDYVGDSEIRLQAQRSALEIWRAQQTAISEPNSALLLEPEGKLNLHKFTELLKRRDDKSMDLQE